jgi:ABC-type transporter Mla subunit MlaD
MAPKAILGIVAIIVILATIAVVIGLARIKFTTDGGE